MKQALPIAFLLVGACAQNSGIRRLGPFEVATAPYADVVASAHAGSLMREGGCVLFRDDATGAHLLPVWPTGSDFNGESILFHEPGKSDQRVVIAQEFVMSGRPIAWTDLPADYAPFRQQCGSVPFLVSKVRPAD